MSEPVTVFVIDDDISVREAIAGVVESVGLRAETYESAAEFAHKVSTTGPSCLVLDVRLPGLSGLDFQKQLSQEGNPIPIVFVTGYGDVPMTVRAMKAGAVEFLTKPFRDQELLDAIGQALERDRTIRRERSEAADVRQRFESLTQRERQVMALVVDGRLTKEIAAQLGTSEITIKVHRSHLMQKMGAKSVVELVKLAARLEETIPRYR